MVAHVGAARGWVDLRPGAAALAVLVEGIGVKEALDARDWMEVRGAGAKSVVVEDKVGARGDVRVAGHEPAHLTHRPALVVEKHALKDSPVHLAVARPHINTIPGTEPLALRAPRASRVR
jgi:hypothetical protein